MALPETLVHEGVTYVRADLKARQFRSSLATGPEFEELILTVNEAITALDALKTAVGTGSTTVTGVLVPALLSAAP